MRRILPILMCIASVGCAATTNNKATTETTQVLQVSETDNKSATEPTKETFIAQGLNCDDSANLNQQQMNQCAQISYQEDDRKLNQAYQQLLPKLPESRREKLRKAQQLWIPYRDAKCDFERSAVEGGSMAPTIYYGCLEETTEARTKQLNGYLTDLAN